MRRKPVIQAACSELFLDLRANLLEMQIVVEVLHIFMVRNVAADGRVAGLADIVIRLRIFLIGSPAISGLLDNFPAEVVVR